jgi:hypothetical protein
MLPSRRLNTIKISHDINLSKQAVRAMSLPSIVKWGCVLSSAPHCTEVAVRVRLVCAVPHSANTRKFTSGALHT